MKKNTLLLIIYTIVLWVILYLAFAFSVLSLDPKVWGADSRLGFSLSCIVGFLLICWATYDENKK